VTLPAVEGGLAAAERTRADIQLSLPAFVVTGRTEEEMAAAAVGVRQQIAFYGSTPAYRGVLEHHGWGDLQGELNVLSKQGGWQAMGELIDDEMLATFAVVAEPDQVGPGLLSRFGDVIDRITFYAPYQAQGDTFAPAIDALRAHVPG
jgi:alkanesulfonate monooxygenase SsuD/methylene tetrahydromethanopterin reductase-like flavin-dependent oxidoreductase (luciferase family)